MMTNDPVWCQSYLHENRKYNSNSHLQVDALSGCSEWEYNLTVARTKMTYTPYSLLFEAIQNGKELVVYSMKMVSLFSGDV